MDRQDRMDPERNDGNGMFGHPEDARAALRGWAIVIASAAGLFLATALILDSGG